MSRPIRSSKSRAGTTLIELIAAVALLGLVFLGMRTLLTQLGDGSDRVTGATLVGDARGNGAATLRNLLRRATVGGDSLHRFIGDDTYALFDSGCDSPAGWSEDCRVALVIVSHGDSMSVVAYAPATAPETLLVHGTRASFHYLDGSKPGYAWLDGWGSNIALPVALAVVTPIDTLVFRVGGR